MKSYSKEAVATWTPIHTVVGWIRILRIQDWSYLVGIAILALARNAVTDVVTMAKVLSFSCIYLCWGYVFNNSFDQHEDSDRKNPFRVARASFVGSVTLVMTFTLVAMAYAWDLLLVTGAVMVLNAVYSAPPVRLKRLLLPSLFSNGVFFGFVYYAAAVLSTGEISPADLGFAAFVFVMFLPLQYVHHLEHEEVAGVKVSGRERSIAAALFVLVAVLPFVPLVGFSIGQAVPGLAYAALGISVVARMESAAVGRIRLRWASAIFGVTLLVVTAFS